MTIVVALAQFAPVEAAKRNKRKRHRNHHSKELLGAADIQRKAAQYAHELLLDLPAGALGSVSITEGTDFQTAVRKNVRGLKAAIASRPAVQRAYAIAKTINPKPTVHDEKSRQVLFGQDQSVVK